MDVIELSAAIREETGKGPAKRLRMEGLLPAVLYGPEIEENLKLSIGDKDLEKILHHSAGGTLLVNLKVESAKKPRMVMFKDVLRHPVSEALMHVDLMEVRMDRVVSVEIPLHFVGKCKGVAMGGILQQDHRVLKAECLPDKIPAGINLDISELEMGHSLHVKDLPLPEGVTTHEEADMTIVSVIVPAVAEETKTAEEIEAEIAGSFAEDDEDKKEE